MSDDHGENDDEMLEELRLLFLERADMTRKMLRTMGPHGARRREEQIHKRNEALASVFEEIFISAYTAGRDSILALLDDDSVVVSGSNIEPN